MYIDVWTHMCRIVDVLPVRQTDETWIFLVFIHRMHRGVLTVMRHYTAIDRLRDQTRASVQKVLVS